MAEPLHERVNKKYRNYRGQTQRPQKVTKGYGRRRRGRSTAPPGRVSNSTVQTTPYNSRSNEQSSRGVTRIVRQANEQRDRSRYEDQINSSVGTFVPSGKTILKKIKENKLLNDQLRSLSEMDFNIPGDEKASLAARMAWNKVWRKVATGLNRALIGPLTTGYIWVQLLFSVVGLGLFGAAALYFEVRDEVEGSIVGQIAGFVGGTVSAALSFLTGGTVNFGEVFNSVLDAPMILWMICYSLVLLFGLFVLLALWAIYTSVGIRCLSGQHAGLKKGMLLLCLIGYLAPFAINHLVPWFVFWMLAVQMYPK